MLFCKVTRLICKHKLHSNRPTPTRKGNKKKIALSIATKPVSFLGTKPTKRIYRTSVEKILGVY